MEPICCGPAWAIGAIEKLAIETGRQIGFDLANIAQGGERIGDHHHCAFLYFCHQDHHCTLSANTLMRFGPASRACLGRV